MAEQPEPAIDKTMLLAVLREAQENVRGYDVKAQIVGIGFIFSLGVIGTIGAFAEPSVPEPPEYPLVAVIVSWFLAILPLGFFGAVLYPSRALSRELGEERKRVEGLLYVSPQQPMPVDTYLAALPAADWAREITFEIYKVSLLREMKRRRFVTALFLAGFSFATLFVLQSLRSSGYIG